MGAFPNSDGLADARAGARLHRFGMVTRLVLAVVLLGSLTSVANVPEPSGFGAEKRLAFDLMGLGGAVAMTSAVFFWVGHSGAELHLSSDGTLLSKGSLDEARSALGLQQATLVLGGLGLATLLAGVVLFVKAAPGALVSVTPWASRDGAGLSLLVVTSR
jgi:hypothetical protein